MLSMTQLHLLQRNFNEAERWTTRIKHAPGPQRKCSSDWEDFTKARDRKIRRPLYIRKRSRWGITPEAHLGFGRLETERNNKVEARRHIVAALDVERPLGKEGVRTLANTPADIGANAMAT